MNEPIYEEKKVLPLNTDELKPIEIIDKNESELLPPIDDDELLINFQKQLEESINNNNPVSIVGPVDVKEQIIIPPLNRNKRITFRVSEDVHRKVKILSIYNNMNIQDVMEQLIIEKLVLYESENPGIFSLMD
jgi:predicted DNA binding CopG/RHH family protein